MSEESTVNLECFDSWLNADTGPAALVIREHLMPVEGPDGDAGVLQRAAAVG